MKFSFALTAIIGSLGLISPILAAGAKPQNATMPKVGIDYAAFDLPSEKVKEGEGRTIVLLTYLLGRLFKHKNPPACQWGRNNCCYGSDVDGCCIGGSYDSPSGCPVCPGRDCPFPCAPGDPTCVPPCQYPGDPNCQVPCKYPGQQNCIPPNPCPGPFCPYPCPGPRCPIVCPGPLCGQLCPGPFCPIRCPGPNCPVQCPGPYCPNPPCVGIFCNIICPLGICNFAPNGRPIIFNVNINQNIYFIDNKRPDDCSCIMVPTPDGPIKVCGPNENVQCYKDYNNQYQVRIKDPNDSRITIEQGGPAKRN